jgi:hypothetical protein
VVHPALTTPYCKFRQIQKDYHKQKPPDHPCATGGTGGVWLSAFFGAPFSKSPLDLFACTKHKACQVAESRLMAVHAWIAAAICPDFKSSLLSLLKKHTQVQDHFKKC